MQHFKANLLAHMMVCKLLDIQQQQGPDAQLGSSVALKVKQKAQAGSQHYDQQQQQQWPVVQQQQQYAAQGVKVAMQQGGAAAAGVLEESSFE
jgi:hypothetical protein